jgi:hypothetical protein
VEGYRLSLSKKDQWQAPIYAVMNLRVP